MLVFARGKDQQIAIGDAITVTILEIQPERVRLQINHDASTKQVWCGIEQIVYIQHDTTITVTRIKGRDHIRIGVQAPREVGIWRMEIYREIKKVKA